VLVGGVYRLNTGLMVYGLEYKIMEKGFILTCRARPITEKAVVDFDIK
jgi:hypothetical protein